MAAPHLLKLLAILAMLLLPLRLAEAAAGPAFAHDATVAFDLGHCSGDEAPAKQHPRAHVHCGMGSAQLAASMPPLDAWIENDKAASFLAHDQHVRAVRVDAPTPPPRLA
jgi:hypothetical protein